MAQTTREVGGLRKQHTATCRKWRAAQPETPRLQDCDCEWGARYRGQTVTFHVWLGSPVDPRSYRAATKALGLFIDDVDKGNYVRGQKRRKAIAGLTFGEVIVEFIDNVVNSDADPHTSNSIEERLGVLNDGLKSYAITELAKEEDTGLMADFLDREGKERKWKSRTWNDYRLLLHSVFEYLVHPPRGKARLAANPADYIKARPVEDLELFKVRQLEEPVEEKLFEVCPQLNRIQHSPNTRGVLTMEKAVEIRMRVENGESQKAVAASFKISEATCSAIVLGKIWNQAKYKVGTKGTEMKRRLIAAFDSGLRAGEMMRLQIKHVIWKLEVITLNDGTVLQGYIIRLPPRISKGGKTRGKMEYVYAMTERFRLMLDQRRLQLKNDPEGFIFGTEQGHSQLGFRRMWNDLFERAGLHYGRDEGLTWHTIRHEYISRLVERCHGNLALVQQLARHRDLKTTMLYIESRRKELLAMAGGYSPQVRA